MVDEFLRCANEDDIDGLRKVIDYNRFLREMKSSRFGPDVALYEETWMRNHLFEYVRGIHGWERIQIVAVLDGEKRGEKVAYGHGFHADGDYDNPVRFWVSQGRRTRLFDWELIEYGVRDTGDWATHFAYESDWRIDNRNEGLSEIESAKALWNEGETEAALVKLRAASRKQVPPPLHDCHLMYVAYTFLAWSENDEVHATCARMKNMDSTPGSHFVTAHAFMAEGQSQKCLEATLKYESLIGRTPESLETKALACLALDRDGEAKQHYFDLLKIMPNDTATLDTWARMLDDDEQHLLAAHLGKLEDTVEATAAMATRLSYDAQAMATLSEVIARHAPDSPTAAFLKAISLQSDGELEQAAALFKQFIDRCDDEEQLSPARYRYMNCMVETDQALQAYEQLGDPQFVFDYLVEDYEYDGALIPHEELVQIVDKHLRLFPDDPWNYYHASLVQEGAAEEGDGRSAVIEKTIRDGLRKARLAGEEDAAAALNRRMVAVMFHRGDGHAAYRTIEPRLDTFQQLANLYRYNTGPLTPTADFQRLIDEHAARHGDDPWLDYFQACVFQELGKLKAAEQSLASALATDAVQEDEHVADDYRQLWLHILCEQGRYMDAYTRVAPAEETFDYLARRLYAEEKWMPLSLLLMRHRARRPDDPTSLYWAVQMHGARDEFIQLAALMRRDAGKLDELPSWQLSGLRALQMRSLLRTNQLDEARQLALLRREKEDDLVPLIVVHVLSGEVEEASALIVEHAKTAYSMNGVYNHEDVKELLRGPAYAEVRRAAPADLPIDYSLVAGVLLLDRAPQLTPQRLREFATDFFGVEAAIGRVSGADDNPAAGAVRLAGTGRRIVLTFGDDVYQADVDLRAEGVARKDLRQLYDRHQGWISIDILHSEDDDSERATARLHKMLASLMDEHTLAVNVEPGWFLPGGDQTQQRLASGDVETTASDTEVWLYRQQEAAAPAKAWLRQTRHKPAAVGSTIRQTHRRATIPSAGNSQSRRRPGEGLAATGPRQA